MRLSFLKHANENPDIFSVLFLLLKITHLPNVNAPNSPSSLTDISISEAQHNTADIDALPVVVWLPLSPPYLCITSST